MIMARIVGTVQDIDLACADGIYRDKFKSGYWVRIRGEDDKVRKVYLEGLSVQDRLVIKAASHFNQTVRSCKARQDLI